MSGYARRASYGPTSPMVGARGARTRRQIVEATLALLDDRGFHATLVDDIAASAAVSRATLYQYFESKEAIFVELVEESGAALQQVVRVLGQLGPDRAGFTELQRWLRSWAEVFDRYAIVFVEWANVNSPKAPLRPRLDLFVETHTRRLGSRLADAGFEGCDPHTMAVALLGVVERFNYMRHVYPSGRTDGELLSALSVASQRALFPTTPVSVLETVALGPATPDAPRPPALAVQRELRPTRPRSATRFTGLGPQAQRTVRGLLDAGARVFSDHGYLASNIDQVVAEAGMSRGTFYKYFTDRIDLLVVLSDECADRLEPVIDDLATISGGPALREWLGRFLELRAEYAGVLRAWTEGLPVEPEVAADALRLVRHATWALRTLLGDSGERSPVPIEQRAMVRVLLALLERSPDIAAGTQYRPTDDMLIEAQALVIERAFLAPPARPRRRTRNTGAS